MKNKFLFALIAMLALTTAATAQVEPTNPAFAVHVENTCHATMQIVLTDMKQVEVKKYKASNQYSISLDGKSWRTYSPIKGEQMLSYEGKYFYSLTRKALVAPLAKQVKIKKASRSPQAQMQRQQMIAQTVGQVVNTVGQRINRGNNGWYN